MEKVTSSLQTSTPSLLTERSSFFSPKFEIQPKLTINTPGDEYEQEADAMAERVMRMPDLGFSSFFKPSLQVVQRKCQHCEEEENKIHRKELNGTEPATNHELDTYVGSLNSSGQTIPQNNRQFFESRFGQDFSNVKIHTDSAAATSAASIQALAYTNGNNIVFGQGQYQPNTENGKRLIAHELTHVVQQGEGVVRRYGHDSFCDQTLYLEPFIWPGHATAKDLLTNVLAAFASSDPRLTTWVPEFFGKDGLSHLSEIEANYKAIDAKLNAQYMYHCNDGSNKNPKALKCIGQRAETDINGWFPSNDITLCFNTINNSWSKWDMAALIIHENFHRAFGGSIHPWAPNGNPPNCANNSGASGSSLLLDNPDSYGCMAIVFR
jgi:hypothetical protein